MKLFKDLIWTIAISCYGVSVIIIEILLGLPLLWWAPIVWLSQWIMDVIQDSTDDTVFYDIGVWYIDRIFVNFIDKAFNFMTYLFLDKKSTENYFRKLVYERLGF